MTFYNINRLDFPNMVDKNIKSAVDPTENYFNALQIMGRSQLLEPRENASSTTKNSIAASLNSIVATVHRKMKSIAPKRRVPSVERQPQPPPPMEADMKKESTTQQHTKRQKRKMNTEYKSSNFRNSYNNIRVPLTTQSIPQVKASWEQKAQQRIHRSVITPSDTNHFVNHQRAMEVLRQKRILEEMLLQHKKLLRDRESIAVEIKCMRTHLNDITQKLDNSLKKLNMSRTICESFPRPKRNTQMQRNVSMKKKPYNTTRRVQRMLSLDSSLINEMKKPTHKYKS